MGRMIRWAVAALTLLLPLAAAYPADEGGATLSLWNRSYLYPDPIPGLSNSHETVFRLSIRQAFTNYGQVSVLADGLSGGGRNGLAQWHVRWRGFRLGGATLETGLGDGSRLLTTSESRFMNTFHPHLYFRGAEVGLASANWGVAAWAGRSARLAGLLGSRYDLNPQTVAGVQARLRTGDRLVLGLGYIGGKNEGNARDDADLSDEFLLDPDAPLVQPNYDAFGPAAARSGLLLVDVEGRLSPWLRWLGQYRRSQFVEQLTDRARRADSLQFGPLVQTRSFTLEASYRRVGRDFRLVSRDIPAEQDVEGLFASAQAQLSESVSVFATWDAFEDNVADDPQERKVRTERFYSGVSVSGRSLPSVLLRAEFAGNASPAGYPLPLDSRARGGYVQISKNLGPAFPYLRHTFRTTDDRRPGETDSWMSMSYLGFRYALRRSSSIWAELGYERRSTGLNDEADDPFRDPWREIFASPRYPGRTEKGSSLTLRAGANRTFSPALSLSAEAFYRKWEPLPRRESLDLYLASTFAFARNWDVRVDLRASLPLGGPGAGRAFTGVTFKLNRRFGWGEPPRIAGRTGLEAVRGSGSVEGFIFEDDNRNLRPDAGEAGVPGIPVVLEDGTTVLTDAEGRYRFPHVADGAHALRLEESGVPADFFILSPVRLDVLVVPRKAQRQDFALVRGVGLEGTVAEDTDGDGRVGPGDRRLADVLVILKPAGEDPTPLGRALLERSILNVFTSPEGRYAFENIPPGEYEVVLDPETLPRGAKVASAHPLRVSLRPGCLLEGQDFAVAPRKIVIKEAERIATPAPSGEKPGGKR